MAAAVVCSKADCTVATTGICLESRVPANTCNFYSTTEKESSGEGEHLAAINADPHARKFHSGVELGSEDAAKLMAGVYAHLIGVVGPHNVGKTCYLLSTYLLAAHRKLHPDYLFAGSLSLRGFEDRARLLRKWGIHIPTKLVQHTSLQDPRSPALLHLALQELQGHRRRVELLFTDLPGEWFSALIESPAGAERFRFLKRADGIVFVIDGPLLASQNTRFVEINRCKLLLQRLQSTVKIRTDIPLVLLVSKCDKLEMQVPDEVEHVAVAARQAGFNPSIVHAVAFCPKGTYASGLGMVACLKHLLGVEWPVERRYYGGEPRRNFAAAEQLCI